MWDLLPHGSSPFERLLPYLDKHSENRIRKLVSNPSSIFAAVFPYYSGKKSGNISMYARGRDYHLTVMGKLQKKCASMKRAYPHNTFIPLVDASPIPEVVAGALCGIGVIGKNGLLINPKFGSFIFIGCILSDLEIPNTSIMPTPCSECNKCIESCPTSALTGHGFDKSKCLSYITQKRGELSEGDTDRLKSGGLIWGCDICQNICPHNNSPVVSPISDFTQDLICDIQAAEIEHLDDLTFKERFPMRAFTWRGVAPLIRNLKLFDSSANRNPPSRA